ncbi:hypothetical protein HYH03_012380 [Edaphochlamys debaryana]|uniref:gluconokinase n=1 Tax=Edaphochlamys debaryana TaxID=47281 RepID=A0A835Y0Z6_9CHLO|nr:hypothetical protein HYH03_012380 [Edaphochlamys debaryana]|eukprot:KAG2489154.1 hypothetical protein HYH03_012380 [Edaphochlamys debaryana]
MADADILVVVAMGPSGCGKSTVGQLLAMRLGCPFLEGDALHPQANIDKMASGVPLTDEDRLPWLLAIHARIREALDFGDRLVVSCSALKPSYRRVLAFGAPDPAPPPSAPSTHAPGPGRPYGRVGFVLLRPSRAVLASRLAARRGHFMPPALLASQLAALAVEPGEVLAEFKGGDGGGEEGEAERDELFPEPGAIVEAVAARLLGGGEG